MCAFYSSFKSRPLYRSRDGMILGVCRGLADYTDLSAFWIRVAVIITFVTTGFFPVVVLYIVAAMLMKPEPILQPTSVSDWEFYNSFASSRSLALARLKRQFEQLERRTRRIEDRITAREFDWENRLRTGR